ncbi:hypothetical protein PVK06_044043 [Gossypium arboreum]|uniref:Zinc finger PMZ-type domain-containing protein n=1 Tax=Gossypium arboreum TaxID=29729 RepID=A0ABR0MQ45_GOSAR|nr:hypothetical protein PVK06_044043 [Gossypium arboreum]
MIELIAKKKEMRLNILIVMFMGAYLGQMMMAILMLVEEEVDLGTENGFGYTIISDQQKAVLSNWSDRKKAKAFEFTFWKIVKSTTKKKWEQKKEELYKINEGFAKELFFKNSKAWTKAFQWLHSVSDIVDNNLYVAFNSSMVESKFKSIITMLEEIIVKMMTRIVDKRKQRSSWKYNYDLLIKKKFDDIKKEGVDWKIIWNGENRCEVKKGRKQYIVNVEDKTSCCRSWQLSGNPCPHAFSAIWHLEQDPNGYLYRYY